MKIRLHQNPSRGFKWEVFAFDETPNGDGIYYTLEITSHVAQRGSLISPATEMSTHQRDSLVHDILECLTEAGLVPKMGATEAELTATKYHLEDFRKLVFKEPPRTPADE